jgi:glycerophosphoryl diester phosphodiesterase
MLTSDWRYPRLCAHRGAGKLAPENTLAAFRLGYAHGYRMVEFDVKLSADGVAFLLHDATLDRTTNVQGRADAHTWRELSQLLAAVAHWSRAHDVAVNIEIKPTPGRERESGAAIALDAATLWGGAPVQPLLSSFSEAALEAARDAVPALPRALLGDRLPEDWLRRATRLECAALDVKHTLLTRARIDEIHDAGLRVLTWTVNDAARATDLLAWGVDTLITDAVDVIAA